MSAYFLSVIMTMGGKFVCKFIKHVVEGKTKVQEISQSYLVLILKLYKSKYIHQFRPIGMCSVIFKVLKKLVVNKWKSMILYLIFQFQSSVVLGWRIIDNIIVAHKITHIWGTKRKRKKGPTWQSIWIWKRPIID